MSEPAARQELPHDLEDMPAGPQLATAIAAVDRRLLHERDRVRLVQARNRMVAHLQAELYADMWAITWGEDPPDGSSSSGSDEPYRWSETELALALRWTRFAAGVRLDQARRMIEDLPAVHAHLCDGLIDVPKALVILDGVLPLELDMARRVVAGVLPKAPELTTGQLRVWLRRLVVAADPDAAHEHAEQRVKARRVQVGLNDANLAELNGYDLAPHRVAASWERLTAIAKAAKAAGDTRSMDELRADALLDLLVGDGIAVGEPITNGAITPPGDELDDDQDEHGSDPDSSFEAVAEPEPAAGQPDRHASAAAGSGADRPTLQSIRRRPGDPLPRPDQPPRPDDGFGTGWPAAPADPNLLDPQADPPPHAEPPPADKPPPAQPPSDEPGRYSDADQERLHPFWMAGFDQLTTNRPADPADAAGQRAVMPGPRRGVMELHMSLSTLFGWDDLPAELAGFGPLLADVARQVATQRPDLAWKLNIYHQGELLARASTNHRPTNLPHSPTGTRRRTKRRPTTEVAEFVRARNRTCVRPGCRRHARSCEIDHNRAWAEGGESDPNNLGPECKPDHVFKHAPGCRLIQSTTGGRFGWITPKGMRYVHTPDPPLYDDIDIIDPL